MELRHLRYFVAVGQEQNFRRAAQVLGVAQPALSQQIQNLEEEIGFKLFDRLKRGVKLSAAGQYFLDEARRILQDVSNATAQARRVATGRSGALRVGFTEISGWHGVVPDSFVQFRERQPDAELQLVPLKSSDQIPAIKSRSLDAGFLVNMASPLDRELDQFLVALNPLVVAMSKQDPLSRVENLRLRDMVNASFIWPSRSLNSFTDQVNQQCFRGGLKSPRIVQESVNEATTLSLVSNGMGIGFVTETARWRCPMNVVTRPVSDLTMALPLLLVWRKDNSSQVLARFVADVRSLDKVRVLANSAAKRRKRSV